MRRLHQLPLLPQRTRFWFGLLLGVTLLMGCDTPSAKDSPANSAPAPDRNSEMNTQELAVKSVLEKKVAKLEVKSVRKQAWGDLFEVVLANNEIIYTNAKADFSLVGHLIDNTNMHDVTQARLDELSVVDFKTLPLNQSFQLVKGDGKRHIAVFEDPNCGYCKIFRKTLEQMDNITVHTFAIDILGEESTKKARQLLCAQDPAHAWDAWMLYKTLPLNEGKCDTSNLDKNKALAEKLGVTGTPAIIFENGKLVPGALPKEALEKMLVEAQAK